MGEAGVDRFHIAHVLNHRSVTHSSVTAIYDRYRVSFLPIVRHTLPGIGGQAFTPEWGPLVFGS
jgi:hypothetical protein